MFHVKQSPAPSPWGCIKTPLAVSHEFPYSQGMTTFIARLIAHFGGLGSFVKKLPAGYTRGMAQHWRKVGHVPIEHVRAVMDTANANGFPCVAEDFLPTAGAGPGQPSAHALGPEKGNDEHRDDDGDDAAQAEGGADPSDRAGCEDAAIHPPAGQQ